MDDEITPTLDAMRDEAIAGLRAFADWLDEHPNAAVPAATAIEWARGRERMVERTRELGGKWEKVVDEESVFFKLQRSFGPLIVYELYTGREHICRRVVKGVRERIVEVPDPAAVAALPTVPQVVVEEDIEWVCPDSLLAAVAVPEGVTHDA